MPAVGGVGRPGVERGRGRWDRAPAFGRVAAGVGRCGGERSAHHRLLRMRAFAEWDAVTCAC